MTANPFADLLAGVSRHYFSQDSRTFLPHDEVLAALDAAVPADLAEAGKVMEGVTPGPWFAGWPECGITGPTTPNVSGSFCGGIDWGRFPVTKGMETIAAVALQDAGNGTPLSGSDVANARFIAWCREGVPAILARIAAQEAQIKGLEAERDEALALAESKIDPQACQDMILNAAAIAREIVAETDAENQRLETALAAEKAKTAKLVEAGDGLHSIVEGIQGAMQHGTWRDEKGQRLKDTPEWVAFYNARAAIMEPLP